MSKYNHMVKFNGTYYKPGEDVPDGKEEKPKADDAKKQAPSPKKIEPPKAQNAEGKKPVDAKQKPVQTGQERLIHAAQAAREKQMQEQARAEKEAAQK